MSVELRPCNLQGWAFCDGNCEKCRTTATTSIAIEALRDKFRTTDDVKNELLAKIVNNSPICRNCDIYRDAWNVCFMASECLTNGFKFCKRRKDGGEE